MAARSVSHTLIQHTPTWYKR